MLRAINYIENYRREHINSHTGTKSLQGICTQMGTLYFGVRSGIAKPGDTNVGMVPKAGGEMFSR